MASRTTNSTINKFAELTLNETTPTIQTLYDWQTKSVPLIIDGTICLAFQGKDDGYSRTLEEAMLSKHYGITALEMKPKNEWKELRKNAKLKFTIPREENDCDVV